VAAPLGAGLTTIHLVGGTTCLGIRVGLETIPPFFLSGARYILAGLILFGWVPSQSKSQRVREPELSAAWGRTRGCNVFDVVLLPRHGG
jgi:hypothetical protein